MTLYQRYRWAKVLFLSAIFSCQPQPLRAASTDSSAVAPKVYDLDQITASLNRDRDAPVTGKIYYLSPQGNDANDGSPNRPWFSLAKAGPLLKPGDRVYLKGGVYQYTQEQFINAQGTEKARIVIQSAPGEHAVLDGAKLPANTNIFVLSSQYVDIRDLEITGSPQHGMMGWRASNLRIIHNHIHHNQAQGVSVMNDHFDASKDNLFYGNLVEDNSLLSKDTDKSVKHCALTSFTAHDSIIVYNIVRRNYGEGICATLTKGGYIARNNVSDNVTVNIYLDNASDIVVEKNIIFNIGLAAFTIEDDGNPATPPRTASGIQVANEDYTIPIDGRTEPLLNLSDRLTIINNMIANTGFGFFYGNYLKGGGLRDSVIANNTFFLSDRALVYIDKDEGHRNTLFANNLFIQAPDREAVVSIFQGSPGISWKNNGWSGKPAPVAASPGDTPLTAGAALFPLAPTGPFTLTDRTLTGKLFTMAATGTDAANAATVTPPASPPVTGATLTTASTPPATLDVSAFIPGTGSSVVGKGDSALGAILKDDYYDFQRGIAVDLGAFQAATVKPATVPAASAALPAAAP